MKSVKHSTSMLNSDSSSEDEESEAEESALVEHISEAELWQFGLTLGIDINIDDDLVWIVREAFSSPVPTGWNVCHDPEGRAYYYDADAEETTWLHPRDKVYREVLQSIKTIRADVGSEDPKLSAVRQRLVNAIELHMQELSQRAEIELQHWSGPYEDAGGHGLFYHNSQTKQSTWHSPVDELKAEEYIHYSILCSCLLSGNTPKQRMQQERSPPRSCRNQRLPGLPQHCSFASTAFQTPRSSPDTYVSGESSDDSPFSRMSPEETKDAFAAMFRHVQTMPSIESH
jgi:hypothetical protein